MSESRAVEINSLKARPFPITVDFSVKENFYCVFLTPMSVSEIIDLLPYNTFLIFNVDTYEFANSKALPLSDVVNKCSGYLTKFDEETLLMDKEQIVKFLDDVSHYNLCLIDAAEKIEIDKVIQIIDLADKLNELTVIEETKSNFFLSSHDDCYFYFETNDENLAYDLISLQIKTLVSTSLNQAINELQFDPGELLTKNEISIVIPQNPVKTVGKVFWKIFEGTFRDFVYREEKTESKQALVYYETNKEIKIENS
jgi:hypothetical protein